MSATNLPVPERSVDEFTVGVCASDEPCQTVLRLLRVIQNEELPPHLVLAKIVIVASSPSDGMADLLRRVAEEDRRILPIIQSERKGKIDAVNSIIESHAGTYIVFVNADALPEPGAIAKLVYTMSSRSDAGAVSACPFFHPSGDLSSRVLDLMWTAHNSSSKKLNHMGLSNHSSDELMVVRSRALVKLPNDMVNDGAYIGGRAFAEGYRVLFSDDARVEIDVPQNVFQLIEQRRRILFGHAQVWKRLGRPPLTLESMMLTNPGLSISLVCNVIASRPSRILAAPIAVMAEITAAILSIVDRLVTPERHIVWRRYRERDERGDNPAGGPVPPFEAPRVTPDIRSCFQVSGDSSPARSVKWTSGGT